MSSLYHDSRLYYILGANSLSAIGSGIVMITIPWLLIKESGGETTFGYVSIISTLIMFLLTPFIGQSIDHFSRKSLLLCNEGIGIAIIGIMVMWGFAGQSYHSIHYILIYIAGSFYYLLFYPTIFAFNQEIFQAEHYKSLSGTMEIQGQLTQVISGAAASFLIEIVSLKWILLVDMLTFAGAFFLFLCIPYVKKKEVKRKITFKKQLFEGIHFMKKRPKLFWFLLATYMPFIGVMMAKLFNTRVYFGYTQSQCLCICNRGHDVRCRSGCCRNLYSTHNEICQNRSFNRYDDVHLCNFNYRNEY